MTVEAWVQPANNTQDGPARIVSSEGSSTVRNFMLGQGAYSNLPDDTYAVRFRTTSALSGTPELFTPAGTATTGLTHVVMTRTAAGVITTYIDGAVQATQTRGGTLANWDASYPLTVANLGSAARPWLGTLCQVAIYDQALTAGEVTDNYTAGCAVGANTDPVLDAIADQSDDEGDTVSVPVTASDPDVGDVLSFSATGLPDGVTINTSTGTMSGTITQTAATGLPYSVEVTASDGRGGVASTTFTWNVAAVNVDPVLTSIGNLLSGEGQTISLTVTATDVDNDTLTFSAIGLPPSLSIDSNSGLISGVTDPGTATYTVTVTVDDGNGGTDFETFDWMVVGNDDPVLDPIGAQSDAEGDTISLAVTAADPNAGDVLTFSATGLPDGLTINSSTGAITGTVTQTAATGSPYTTTVTVDDGVGGTDDETFQWDIAAVNVAPVATNPGTQTSNEGDTVSVTIAATDADGDTLTFSATGLPTGLTINTATGAITGTIAAGAATGSPYAVTVTVGDGTTTIPVAFTWNVGVITGPAPVVRYAFTEGSGATVGDSGSGAPLNLTIANPGNVTWVPGGGLTVDASTVITSGAAATKVTNAVQATNEMTVEAWVQPANNTQSGPARIVSSEGSSTVRNFMLGQGAYSNLPDDTYAVRFRTTSALSGTPELFTPAGTATTGLTHVVMTRTAAGVITTYIDGAVQATQTRGGTLANWDASYPLTVANLGSAARPWLGTLCQVAIYDQALTAGEVTDNYTAGCDLPAPPAAALVQITPGGGIGATTFGNSTITVTNTGGSRVLRRSPRSSSIFVVR